MREWVSELEKALAMEQEVLRAADRHRRNAEKLDKESFLDHMTTIVDQEIKALDSLKKMFSWVFGVRVRENGKRKKAVLQNFVTEYRTAAKASRVRTQAILENLD